MSATVRGLVEDIKDKLHLTSDKDVIVEKEPVVTKRVQEADVVDRVIDDERVEVHKRDVVTEIHKQPIIEVVERPVTEHIHLATTHEKTVKPALVEKVDHSSHPHVDTAHVVGFQGTEHLKEHSSEEVRAHDVIKRVEVVPEIEIHEQPRVTEIYHRTVVEHIDQPVTRVIYEEPIIRHVVDKGTVIHTEATERGEHHAERHHHEKEHKKLSSEHKKESGKHKEAGHKK